MNRAMGSTRCYRRGLAAATLLGLLLLVGCGTQAPPAGPNAAPPTVTLVADATSGEATFTTTFRASASDPDGNPLSYAWSVDGVEDARVTGSVASVTFSRAGTYRVAVVVSDGRYSARASVDVRVRDEFRPLDAPDVLVIGFAGRCGVDIIQCFPPGDNFDYLGDSPAPGTMTALAGAFDQLGFSVGVADFRANLFDDALRGFGYQTAHELVRFARDTLVRDYQDPTRLVLVGHSHGAQFMSLLAFDNGDVVFDYAIYLDAVCNAWDFDHIDTGAFAAAYGAQANYPYPLNVTGRGCDAIALPGVMGGQHLGDVVPSNVAWALEVQSGDTRPLVRDLRTNHRLDGRTGPEVGIETEYFAGETHDTVKDAGTPAMNWVVGRLLARGLSAGAAAGASAWGSAVMPAPREDAGPVVP